MYAKLGSVVVSLLLVAALATSSLAAGFAIIEQSVSGLGNAFAGGAAGAEDATTIFFNPAGMMRLEGQQLIGAGHLIVPSAEFKASSAMNSSGNAISGGNGGDAGETGLVPNLYYLNRLNDSWAVGLGVNAPFALSTEYGRTWIGRYHGVESAVTTININPSLAYKVNENFSVGAGVNVQYIEATLSSMVDGRALAASPFSSPATDVFVENEADDWSLGFNLGLLYEFNNATRIGFAYRSEIKHELEGTTKTALPAAFAPSMMAQALFANQGVNGKITLPATASLSLYHKLNDKLALMGDVTWTGWSSFDKLVLNFEGAGIGGAPFTRTDENWDDTWRVSLGASYYYSETLTLRGGLAFDETPIPSAELRTPRIPGEDRYWISLGAGYTINENLVFDFGYAHLFVSDSDINKTVAENPNLGSLVGEYENSVDIASIQLSYRF